MIRQATLEDFDNLDLYSMGMAFYKESNLPGKFVPSTFRANWQKFVALNIGVVFLLFEDDKIIGAIGGLIHPDPYDAELVAQEMFWFTSPKSRGKLGAIKLYITFEAWAKERGAKRLCMACVCNHMIGKLRNFYESRGFTPKDISYFKAL